MPLSDKGDLLVHVTKTMKDSGADLELAKALLDLGVARARSNDRKVAVELLQRALRLAEGCDAAALLTRVRGELRTLGSKPARTSPAAGETTLTSGEQRVVELATRGLTNREIAAELFVSVKAVEYHLGNVYAKLGIARRGDLSEALGLRSG